MYRYVYKLRLKPGCGYQICMCNGAAGDLSMWSSTCTMRKITTLSVLIKETKWTHQIMKIMMLLITACCTCAKIAHLYITVWNINIIKIDETTNNF